jgi:hypothetical protein
MRALLIAIHAECVSIRHKTSAAAEHLGSGENGEVSCLNEENTTATTERTLVRGA